MTPKSAKAKGRRLQAEVRERILAAHPHLEPADVKCAIMGERGEDLHFSPAARKVFPFSVEAKNVESLNVWKALEQAQANANGAHPLLVFKRNRTDIYAALPLDTLLALLAK